MPHYHLNLAGPRSVIPDDEGAEFQSLEHAYLEAFKGAREMWLELLVRREDPRSFTFEIADSAGAVLMTVPLSEVLDSCRRSAAEPLHAPAAVPEESGARPSSGATAAPGIAAYAAAAANAQQMQRLSAELTEQLARTRATLESTRALVRAKGSS